MFLYHIAALCFIMVGATDTYYNKNKPILGMMCWGISAFIEGFAYDKRFNKKEKENG